MAKTFCLVFWIKDKSKTVMEEPQDFKDIDEGGEVNIFYDKKSYKAILLARSGKNVSNNFCNYFRLKKKQ